MTKIYFVEDDQAIGYIIEKTIENAGLKGFGYRDGQSFLSAYQKEKPDMVLLDVMLPDMSGIDILKKIRKLDDQIPVLMISALQNEMDKVIALDLGADDYITKPFGVLELTSRIQSKLRKKVKENFFQLKDVSVDHLKHETMINNEVVYLTNKEYNILFLLLKNQQQVVSKETIFKEVWETDFIGETRTLDMHIKSLRQKLIEKNSETEIKTIRGVGYQIK